MLRYRLVPAQEDFVKKQQRASVESGSQPARERILHAAMEAFMELGYTEASTLKIATEAQVSKRELYALFGNKQAMLAACIADRAGRMRLPAELPPARNREDLVEMLSRLGTTVLREVSHPGVMAVFRLAITEAQRAPEVAKTLEMARESIRTTVQKIVSQAQSSGLIAAGDPADAGGRYLALLWGDSIVSMLLRVREAPGPAEIDQRARQAAEDFLRLYSGPEKRARPVASRARK
jgi:AcrR family transcriptional regulator